MGVCSHRHKEIKFDPRNCVPKKQTKSAVMTAAVARDRCDNISKKWGFACTDTKKSNSTTKKSNSTELSCKKRRFGPRQCLGFYATKFHFVPGFASENFMLPNVYGTKCVYTTAISFHRHLV